MKHHRFIPLILAGSLLAAAPAIAQESNAQGSGEETAQAEQQNLQRDQRNQSAERASRRIHTNLTIAEVEELRRNLRDARRELNAAKDNASGETRRRIDRALGEVGTAIETIRVAQREMAGDRQAAARSARARGNAEGPTRASERWRQRRDAQRRAMESRMRDGRSMPMREGRSATERAAIRQPLRQRDSMSGQWETTRWSGQQWRELRQPRRWSDGYTESTEWDYIEPGLHRSQGDALARDRSYTRTGKWDYLDWDQTDITAEGASYDQRERRPDQGRAPEDRPSSEIPPMTGRDLSSEIVIDSPEGVNITRADTSVMTGDDRMRVTVDLPAYIEGDGAEAEVNGRVLSITADTQVPEEGWDDDYVEGLGWTDEEEVSWTIALPRAGARGEADTEYSSGLLTVNVPLVERYTDEYDVTISQYYEEDEWTPLFGGDMGRYEDDYYTWTDGRFGAYDGYNELRYTGAEIARDDFYRARDVDDVYDVQELYGSDYNYWTDEYDSYYDTYDEYYDSYDQTFSPPTREEYGYYDRFYD